MQQTKRAWTYCRIASSQEDAFFRLEQQKKGLINAAEKMGFYVVGSSEELGSGLDLERPGLTTLKKAALEGQMDVLLLVNLSRISRNFARTLQFLREMEQYGVKVYSINEGEINFKDYTFTQDKNECEFFVGQKIKMYRKKCGFTQKELADISGVSEASIRKYEAGTRNPKEAQIRKLSVALNITGKSLLYGIKPKFHAYCPSELKSYPKKKLSEHSDKEYYMDSKQRELYAAAAPLMAYMRKNHNPHAKVIVDQSSAELLIGQMTAHLAYDSGVLDGDDH